MKIFFDLDGTLIDVSQRHYIVYKQVVEELLGKPLKMKTYWDLKRRKADWKEVLKQSYINEKLKQQFLDKFILKIESPEYTKKDKLFNSTKDTLDKLSNYSLYIVSLRRSEEALLNELAFLGIKDKVIKVLSGHTESDGYTKKAELISTIGFNSSDIVVGDTEADILAAKQLGLRSIAVSSGIRTTKLLQATDPDYLITDISQLPQLLTKILN